MALVLAGCLKTPPTSSWATDVYRIRFGALKQGMTTAQVLETMCNQGPMHSDGNATVYDLTEGYTITLFYNEDRDHPREVVLHTPYAGYSTNWSALTPAELAIGTVTTQPAR